MKEEFYAEYYEIENVHWWFLGRWHIFMSLIDQEFPAADRVVSLDVGCGTGTMVGHLESYGPAFGVDGSSEAARFCQSRGRTRVTQGDATRLPFDDGSFDLVCALDLLEHVTDDVAALAEFARVCRPDGRVLITVPAYRLLWGRQDEISHHLRRYTSRELVEKTRQAGLAVQKVTYFNTVLFPLIAAIRVGRQLLPGLGSRELASDFSMTRPGPLNDLLASVFRLESAVIRYGSLPFGVSVLVVARPRAGT